MEKVIKLQTHEEAQALCGRHDANLRLLEKEFKVKAHIRGEHLKLSGIASNLKGASGVIEYIISAIRAGQADIGHRDFLSLISNFKDPRSPEIPAFIPGRTKEQKQIGPKTRGQTEYFEAIKNFDIVFGIGPAGTGKTYLAMACAVEALKKQEVRRIILTRPAVEAGESLGYLPGDMKEKISPYLRPLYDAIYDMMEAERIEKYIETGIIEVAPLAYMRGRTLNDAFIVLDEAQNCTAEQMKMFLTRLGFDSKAVITGDITQSDLPDGRPIGLLQAQDILKDIEGIKFIYFTGSDVVRHALVQRIIEAYDKTSR
jgi:phosphate starvation-inducible PhoH-like protein